MKRCFGGAKVFFVYSIGVEYRYVPPGDLELFLCSSGNGVGASAAETAVVAPFDCGNSSISSRLLAAAWGAWWAAPANTGPMGVVNLHRQEKMSFSAALIMLPTAMAFRVHLLSYMCTTFR